MRCFMVTGGSGFIGMHLSDFLNDKFKDNDLNIINLDLIQPLKRLDNVEYIKGDVRKSIDIIVKDDISVIFNLAAVHKTPGHPDYDYFETNIKGAENVCEFARKNNINTIVFTSSIAPYGASNELKTEETLPTPNTPYGISKLVAEEIHKRWQAEDPENRKLIILRPGVVFGENEGGNFTRLYKMMKKRMFFYPGSKRVKKASIYVKDLVRMMFEMTEKESVGVSLYNMCYPEPPEIYEICKNIAKVIGCRTPWLVIPGSVLKIPAWIISIISKITGVGFMGIDPARIDKLIVSTNISGKKLQSKGYILEYSLEKAIENWILN